MTPIISDMMPYEAIEEAAAVSFMPQGFQSWPANHGRTHGI